jgi:hypothetical protein
MRPKSPNSATADDAALKESLAQLLAPMAHLCLARGLSFAVVEEMLKRAFVAEARAGHSDSSSSRDVSRVSAATGLSRREVTRITLDVPTTAAVRPSLATQVFTRWMGSKKLHDKSGKPRPLKRQGRAPSFDALVLSVTRDVHPRTLLEELCRLGLAHFDVEADTVSLLRDSFVPSQDKAHMFRFLGSNVGEHMAAAVENVLAEASPSHPEQAVFADGLSAKSTAAVRALVKAQWKQLLTEVVPELQKLVDADAKSGLPNDHRVRIGLYSYHTSTAARDEESEE